MRILFQVSLFIKETVYVILNYMSLNRGILLNSHCHSLNVQSVPYHIGLSLRLKDKNTRIILEKSSIICKKNFPMALYDF